MARMDRKGMAMVFDALVFLTIISVVSVALMNAICIERTSSGTGRYVSEVHNVALQCSFEGEGLASMMTIEDVLVLSMLGNETIRLEEVDRQLEMILDGYMGPLYDFEHATIIGDKEHRIGNEKILGNDDIFVSTIGTMDVNGNDVRFVLSVSFA
ncbi:MAG: hypothetical protein WC375_11660 [Methanomassiliicoccales archaeon]